MASFRARAADRVLEHAKHGIEDADFRVAALERPRNSRNREADNAHFSYAETIPALRDRRLPIFAINAAFLIYRKMRGISQNQLADRSAVGGIAGNLGLSQI